MIVLKRKFALILLMIKLIKKVFDSVIDASKYVGISKAFVSRVARGQCKQSHGWVFDFIN